MSDRVRLGSVLAAAMLFLSILAACGGGDNGNGNGGDAPGNDSGNGDTGNSELASEARQIYDSLDCAECHGPDGEGDGANPRMTLAGTNLIIQQFRTRIRNGKGEQMPGYSEEQISEEEIQILFDWFSSQ